MPESAATTVQRYPSEKLQEDKREKEPLCEEKTVSKVPQKHQDNPQRGHKEQLPGEQKYQEI